MCVIVGFNSNERTLPLLPTILDATKLKNPYVFLLYKRIAWFQYMLKCRNVSAHTLNILKVIKYVILAKLRLVQNHFIGFWISAFSRLNST